MCSFNIAPPKYKANSAAVHAQRQNADWSLVAYVEHSLA